MSLYVSKGQLESLILCFKGGGGKHGGGLEGAVGGFWSLFDFQNHILLYQVM